MALCGFKVLRRRWRERDDGLITCVCWREFLPFLQHTNQLAESVCVPSQLLSVFPPATITKGVNASSWTSERSPMFGGHAHSVTSPFSTSLPTAHQVTSIDGVSFCEGELLLQVREELVC